jgi:hypothetical protein
VLLQAPLAAFRLGGLPEPSLGLAVAGGASVGRWRFLVEGALWRAQHMTARDEPGAGADVRLITVGPRMCWAAIQGVFDLAPCLTLTVEHVWAEGTGEHIAPRTAETTWLAAGIGVGTRWRMNSWFALAGRASAEIETSRPKITIDGVGQIGRLGPAALTVMLGPEWIF